MSNYRRAKCPGGSFFFTVVTYRRQPILCDDFVRSAFRDAILSVRRTRPFTIDAWVMLPDHLHCIWTLPPDDQDFSTRWGLIKREVSRMITPQFLHRERLNDSKRKHREGTVWQRRFWEHCIRDEVDWRHHLDYLHFNPVKHGLVSSVAEWPFSTFHRFVREGMYRWDWCGNIQEKGIPEP